MTETAPLLEMTGIHKSFVGVKALDNVELRLRRGEVHALMGENGAGKSTLIKALTGVYPVDARDDPARGAARPVRQPAGGAARRISTVYQEVNLCPNLSVAENLYLGREPRRLGRIHWRAMRRSAVEALARVDVRSTCRPSSSTHSLAIQQMVAIARAIDISAGVLILDEPTSSLDQGEVAAALRRDAAAARPTGSRSSSSPISSTRSTRSPTG